MELDILYILGLWVVWVGNLMQIVKMVRTKSTRSLSFCWLILILVSIGIRLPRAWTSTYPVWQFGYAISFAICLILVLVALYYKRKYPRK